MAGFGDTKVQVGSTQQLPEKIWNILDTVHNVNGEDFQKEDSRGYLQLAGLKILEKVGDFYLAEADPTWKVRICGGRVTYFSHNTQNGQFTFIQSPDHLCVVITPVA